MTNMELYGTKDVPDINKEDCEKRIQLLQTNLARVSKDPARYNFTIRKIKSAIKFWTRMAHGEGDFDD